jgi:hypothetical protein
MRQLILLGLVTIAAATCAQTQQTVCDKDVPRYADWVSAQKLPFVASDQRQKELSINYSNVKLGMTRRDVMGLLGSPDYAADGSSNPVEITCVWGYAVEDSGLQPGARHRGILVGFDGNGSTVSLEPTALHGLSPLHQIDASCKRELADYATWFSDTALAHGAPYVIDDRRKAELLGRWPKLSLGMSRAEAETTLGKPDFEQVTPLRGAKYTWSPKLVCIRQLAYVVSQAGDNLADTTAQGLYLSFDDKDKLFWASPQNVSGLKPLGGPMP